MRLAGARAWGKAAMEPGGDEEEEIAKKKTTKHTCAQESCVEIKKKCEV
jgi:hypothetical protein